MSCSIKNYEGLVTGLYLYIDKYFHVFIMYLSSLTPGIPFPRKRSKQGGVNASAFSLLGVTIPLYYPSTWICLFLPA